jgi:3'(2'), 5'-bisphosphate nucleotidase
MSDLADHAFRRRLLQALIVVSREAGEAIMPFHRTGAEVIRKADDSPVTAADHAAEAIILKALARLAPGIPVVAEEEAAAGRAPEVKDTFFLVDPLDGTRDFIRGGKEFTVNIGLVEDLKPTLGVIYAPAFDRLYAGDATTGEAVMQEAAAPLRPIHTRQAPDDLTVLLSSTRTSAGTERYLALIPVGERVRLGSSLKFGVMAAGGADFYPRPLPTMEWDTCAGEAILRAAGGRVLDIHGRDLPYGKPGFLNPGFVATTAYDPPPLAAFMN